MVFTLEDFDKIWASTSPLTPYEFSDSNYQQGWNFIGATPPARQMWDFLQKQNDEKMQWLYNNKLSLSGGTMTGAIESTSNPAVKSTTNNRSITIAGGMDTSVASGAKLILSGGERNDYTGEFILQAGTGTTYKQLVGDPNGTLTWGVDNVLTDATVGTVVTKSISSSVSLTTSTAKTITSISLTAGTWVVTGHISYTSVTADKIYGAAITTTANRYGYANDGTIALHSASNGTIVPNVTNVLKLESTTTVYLCGYATASATVGDAHITAVRIV